MLFPAAAPPNLMALLVCLTCSVACWFVRFIARLVGCLCVSGLPMFLLPCLASLAYLIACVLACQFARLLACLPACLLACWLVCLLACLLACTLSCLLVDFIACLPAWVN